MARWRWWLAALLVLGTLITPSLLTPTTSSAAPSGCGVSGEAYGARASVLGTTTLDKVARVVLPPGGTNGSASASLPIGGSLGTISTSATDTSTPTLASATSTATVDGTNLLAGLITATEIKAVANSSTDGVTATNSATGTTFTNLVIGGNPIASNVAPNSGVTIAGVASIIVNEQITTGNGTTTAGLTVNGLHIKLLNGLGIPTGVEAIVAAATSGVTCAGPIPSPSGSPSASPSASPGTSPSPGASPSPGTSPNPTPSPSFAPGEGQPGVVLNPSNLPFTNQPVGSASPPQIVRLTNNGSGPLLIGGIAIVGDNPGDFSQTNDCGLVVPAGANCTITVTFTPTATGPRSAILQVTDNAAGSPQMIPLSGTGAAVLDSYVLTLLNDGPGSGTFGVAATQAGTPAGPNATRYPAGTVVTLTPQPASGVTFIRWTVDEIIKGWAGPLTITMNADHTAVGTFVPTPGFPDVAGNTPFMPAIMELAARGIIRGYEDGTFGPADTSVRAQMAALVARSLNWDPEDHGNPFTDRCLVEDPNNCVDANLWRNVGTLAYYRVAFGYTDAPTCQTSGVAPPCYLPRDQVLRIQVISFITRAMVTKGYWQYQPDNPAIYPNVPVGSGHRVDLSTYVFYAGQIPDRATNADWTDWDTAAPRAWFAGVLWQALNSYFGVDDPFLADGLHAGGYVP